MEKPIPGYEDYLATENGDIVSLKNGGRRVLKPRLLSKGYLRVNLCHDGCAKTMLVHRLVWSAFRGPIPPDREIAHDDGDPGNNKLDNLKCVTHAENEADKRRHGTIARGERHSKIMKRVAAKGERHGRAKLTADQVREIRAEYETSNFSQRELAARYDISKQHISDIVRGEKWTHISD